MATVVKKDARINLAFKPALKKQIEDLASVDGISVNALIENLCSEYAARRADDIAEFDACRARIRQKTTADFSAV